VGAVPYLTFDAVVRNIEWQMSFFPILLPLSSVIEVYRLANPILAGLSLSTDNRHDVLRGFTGCVSALSPDVNCWPLGFDSAVCFDADGLPIP